MTLDLGSSYRYWANRENVTLHYRKSGWASEVVSDCKRICDDVAEAAPSDGKYQRRVLDFRLPATNVDHEINPGDYIEDAQHRLYVIQAVDHPQMNAPWRCYCNVMQIQDLGQRATIHQPTDSIGSDTSANTALAADSGAANILCVIQPAGTDMVHYQGQTTIRRLFRIWVPTQTNVVLGSVVISAGQNYTVLGIENQNRIDELACLLCRLDT